MAVNSTELESDVAGRGLSVVMAGATGAVGGEVVDALTTMSAVRRVTLLGRRAFDRVTDPKIGSTVVDLEDPTSYASLLPGHEAAICTVGIGQPSQVSRAEFVRIDKDLVLAFATACKQAGVRHFQMLGSVGASARSPSWYLRTKGELEDGLRDLGFHRLSVFRPSMILTPTNRYGLSQAIALAVWPLLSPLMFGGLRRFRGIRVADLGRAIAHNLGRPGAGAEMLHWQEITALLR